MVCHTSFHGRRSGLGVRIDGGVIRRAKCNLGHSGGPYTRDVTNRGGEPTAKQQIEVLGLENSGEPWLDVLSSTIDQGVPVHRGL